MALFFLTVSLKALFRVSAMRGALRLREEATTSGLKFVKDERSSSKGILNYSIF